MPALSLPLCVLCAWLVIVVFYLVPKKLSLLDLIFLYFAVGICITSTFTYLDVDAHTSTVSRSLDKSLAVIVCRVVTIPLLLILTANAVRSWTGMRRWGTLFAVFIMLTAFDTLLGAVGMITYHHRGLFDVVVMYAAFIAFTNLVAWWFSTLKGKVVSRR